MLSYKYIFFLCQCLNYSVLLLNVILFFTYFKTRDVFTEINEIKNVPLKYCVKIQKQIS